MNSGLNLEIILHLWERAHGPLNPIGQQALLARPEVAQLVAIDDATLVLKAINQNATLEGAVAEAMAQPQATPTRHREQPPVRRPPQPGYVDRREAIRRREEAIAEVRRGTQRDRRAALAASREARDARRLEIDSRAGLG